MSFFIVAWAWDVIVESQLSGWVSYPNFSYTDTEISLVAHARSTITHLFIIIP